MNSYERYIGMVKGQKVDCVPRIPILMHFAAKYIDAAYADFAGQYQVMVEANRRLVEDFGFDQLDVMSDPWREATGFGAQIEYLQETVPRCTFHPLQNSKDLSQLLKPDPYQSERMHNSVKAIGEYKKIGWQKYSITGWVEGPAAEAADLRGVTNFMMDLYDDETFVGDLMDRCIETAIDYAEAQIKEGADTIGIGDAIASQISPDMYERLVLPREKKLVQAIQQAGGLTRLHICGNINHLLPMIAELKVDIIDCDWMVDMEVARKTLGPNITLAGNLDPVNTVMRSTPDKIRQGFLDIYQKVGNPYFVNAGCEIPVGTPVENFKALCEPIPAM
jgi:MtaA/CmuA family methyltransferase